MLKQFGSGSSGPLVRGSEPSGSREKHAEKHSVLLLLLKEQHRRESRAYKLQFLYKITGAAPCGFQYAGFDFEN